ncbi:hypothetical protein ABKN59_004860 [Abortiporus biennis]
MYYHGGSEASHLLSSCNCLKVFLNYELVYNKRNLKSGRLSGDHNLEKNVIVYEFEILLQLATGNGCLVRLRLRVDYRKRSCDLNLSSSCTGVFNFNKLPYYDGQILRTCNIANPSGAQAPLVSFFVYEHSWPGNHPRVYGFLHRRKTLHCSRKLTGRSTKYRTLRLCCRRHVFELTVGPWTAISLLEVAQRRSSTTQYDSIWSKYSETMEAMHASLNLTNGYQNNNWILNRGSFHSDPAISIENRVSVAKPSLLRFPGSFTNVKMLFSLDPGGTLWYPAAAQRIWQPAVENVAYRRSGIFPMFRPECVNLYYGLILPSSLELSPTRAVSVPPPNPDIHGRYKMRALQTGSSNLFKTEGQWDVLRNRLTFPFPPDKLFRSCAS